MLLANKGFEARMFIIFYRGDPAVVDYVSPVSGAKYGSSGSLSIVTTPNLPTITVPAFIMEKKYPV